MVVIICGKYRYNRSRTENVTRRTQFSKSRSNDLEDIGQGQRSSHATHLLMLVIICTKYGKNPSRTVDATERTRFSRARPNYLEDIGQGQRSLYATHPLILMIICAKYGKNQSENCRFFPRSRPTFFLNFPKIQISRFWKKFVTRDTPSNDSDQFAKYKKNPSRTVDATERTQFSKSRPNDLEDIGPGQRSWCATHPLMVVIIFA